MQESLDIFNKIHALLRSGNFSLEYDLIPLIEKVCLDRNSVSILSKLSDMAYAMGHIEAGGVLYEYRQLEAKNKAVYADIASRKKTADSTKPQESSNIIWNRKDRTLEAIRKNVSLKDYPEEILYKLYNSIYKNTWQSLMSEDENRELLVYNYDNIWKIRDYCIAKSNAIFEKLSLSHGAKLKPGDKVLFKDELSLISKINIHVDSIQIEIAGRLENISVPRDSKIISLTKEIGIYP